MKGRGPSLRPQPSRLSIFIVTARRRSAVPPALWHFSLAGLLRSFPVYGLLLPALITDNSLSLLLALIVRRVRSGSFHLRFFCLEFVCHHGFPFPNTRVATSFRPTFLSYGPLRSRRRPSGKLSSRFVPWTIGGITSA